MTKKPTHFGSTRVARATRNRQAHEDKMATSAAKREEAASAYDAIARHYRESAARLREAGNEEAASAMDRRADEREARATGKRGAGKLDL